MGDFNNADTFNYFALRYGKINMLIGIARKEEGRVNNTASSRWQQRSISKVYPLIEISYDRSGCQAYIRQVNKNV